MFGFSFYSDAFFSLPVITLSCNRCVQTAYDSKLYLIANLNRRVILGFPGEFLINVIKNVSKISANPAVKLSTYAFYIFYNVIRQFPKTYKHKTLFFYSVTLTPR